MISVPKIMTCLTFGTCVISLIHPKLYAGTKGFPVQRKNQTNNFMAAVVAQNQYIWKKCPTKCRPADHKDWEYC